MADTLVRTRRDGRVHTITLDSPRNRNALSRALMGQATAALAEAAHDEDVDVVLLRAAGPAFCAGADLKEAAVADGDAQAATSQRILALLRAVVASPVPVVAVVHGPVRAGGVGLVAACDLAIASTAATFAIGEVRLGLAPAVISTVVVPRLTDRDAARLLLGGGSFTARHAAAVGLLTDVAEPDELEGAVDALLTELRASPRQALVATKSLLTGDLLDRIDREGPAMATLSAALFQSETARERFRRVIGG